MLKYILLAALGFSRAEEDVMIDVVGPEACYDEDGELIADCYCHYTCGSCGYYDWPDAEDDCVTCADEDLEVDAVYEDGTGYCSHFEEPEPECVLDEDTDIESCTVCWEEEDGEEQCFSWNQLSRCMEDEDGIELCQDCFIDPNEDEHCSPWEPSDGPLDESCEIDEDGYNVCEYCYYEDDGEKECYSFSEPKEECVVDENDYEVCNYCYRDDEEDEEYCYDYAAPKLTCTETGNEYEACSECYIYDYGTDDEQEECYEFEQKRTCVTTSLGYTHCENCDKYDWSDMSWDEYDSDYDYDFYEYEVAEAEEDVPPPEDYSDEYCYLEPAVKEDCRKNDGGEFHCYTCEMWMGIQYCGLNFIVSFSDCTGDVCTACFGYYEESTEEDLYCEEGITYTDQACDDGLCVSIAHPSYPGDDLDFVYILDDTCAYDAVELTFSCDDGTIYPAEGSDCIEDSDANEICHYWGEYFMPDPEDEEEICYYDSSDRALFVCEPVYDDYYFEEDCYYDEYYGEYVCDEDYHYEIEHECFYDEETGEEYCYGDEDHYDDYGDDCFYDDETGEEYCFDTSDPWDEDNEGEKHCKYDDWGNYYCEAVPVPPEEECYVDSNGDRQCYWVEPEDEWSYDYYYYDDSDYYYDYYGGEYYYYPDYYYNGYDYEDDDEMSYQKPQITGHWSNCAQYGGFCECNMGDSILIAEPNEDGSPDYDGDYATTFAAIEFAALSIGAVCSSSSFENFDEDSNDFNCYCWYNNAKVLNAAAAVLVATLAVFTF